MNFKTFRGIAILTAICVVFLALFAIVYYGKTRIFKKSKNSTAFNKKKTCYICFLIFMNLLLSFLVYFYGSFQGFFVIIVLFKSKDIVSVCIQIIVQLQSLCKSDEYSSTFLQNDHRIVSVLPVYNETIEEFNCLMESIKNETNDRSLICIIEDHGTLHTDSYLTSHLATLCLPYFSWKQQTLNIVIKIGLIDKRACIILIKDTNYGKRDSLILAHDCFNVPRSNLNETNLLFRSTLRNKITETFGLHNFEYIFCTDGDSIICENSFAYLIQSINSKKAIAACGLVVVNDPSFAFWNVVQNFQYFYGQYIRRQTECIIKKVTCLPGCITMFKVDPVADPAITMYADIPKDKNFIKNIVQTLGTDRRLTTSFLFQNPKNYTVFDDRAVCLTNTPTSLHKYLDQRRRWCSNAYFNSIYIITNKNIHIVTRIFALLDYLRMSLIYFRCFNTVTFLIKLSYSIKSNLSKYISIVLNLTPCMCILFIPVLYFVFLCIIKPTARKRSVYLFIGFFVVKCIGTVLSVLCVTNMLWFCGDKSWSSSVPKRNEDKETKDETRTCALDIKK